jgi:hypothetical protein
MIETTPEAFYTKLFSAMEAGHRKGERTLLQKLMEHFGLQSELDIRLALARGVPPEDAMVWLLSEAQPFVSMLEEIYCFLADGKATILGNADQFSFRFDEFNQRVAFPLDSFLKTYIRSLTDVEVLKTLFEPAARGRLMVDTPNYWHDDAPALRVLSCSPVLRSNTFNLMPPDYQQAVRARARIAIKVLDTKYVPFDVPDSVDEWTLRQHKRIYFANQMLLDRVVRLLEETTHERQTSWSKSSPGMEELIREGMEAGTIVNGDNLLDCLRFADEVLGPLLDKDMVPKQLNFPAEGLDSNLTYAFIQAFNLCFQTSASIIQDYIDIIDKVFLPFYRHRWRLFEIWAILWVRDAIPQSQRPQPNLSPRSDDPNCYEWVIPGGDAHTPVAIWEHEGKTLELWYQQKTPLSPEHAATFGQANIEPDIRVRGGDAGNTVDLAILELKDRFKARGSEEKKIARMYATTGSRFVCVANYSEFGSRTLSGQIYREMAGDTEIILVDEFMPGKVPPEVLESFIRAINGIAVEFDLLGDVSGSMDPTNLRQTFQTIADLGISPAHLFVFNTDLKELPKSGKTDWPSGGETDLVAAIDKYLASDSRVSSGKVIILTDSDGVQQFKRAGEVIKSGGLNVLCLNLNEKLDINTLTEWVDKSNVSAPLTPSVPAN